MTQKDYASARKFVDRITKVIVLPEGEPIFSEETTRIEIVDDAGGEFIRVSQELNEGGIEISFEEWPTIKKSIDEMFARIKE